MQYNTDIPEVNVEFNVTNAWFNKHVPNARDFLPKLMAINDVHPVGKLREDAYVTFMVAEIRKLGLFEQFEKDTDTVIAATTMILEDYKEYVAKFHAFTREFQKGVVDVVDRETMAKLQTICNQVHDGNYLRAPARS